MVVSDIWRAAVFLSTTTTTYAICNMSKSTAYVLYKLKTGLLCEKSCCILKYFCCTFHKVRMLAVVYKWLELRAAHCEIWPSLD